MILGHLLGEYLYVLARDGLTLRHKTYSITQEDCGFLESKSDHLKGEFGTYVKDWKDIEEAIFG